MRRIIDIAALIVVAASQAQAQSAAQLPLICTPGNGHDMCARLLPPRPRVDVPPPDLQAPEGPYSTPTDLGKLGITPAAIPSPAQPLTPDRAITGFELTLPASGSAGAFRDVLGAVRRHRSERDRAEGTQVVETAERKKIEQALSEEARGLMDPLRVDLGEMNDLAPGVPPDITVDKSAVANNAAQIKGQLILSWQDMRDEFCKQNPGAKYVGLDSHPRHCQDPRAGREKRAADEALNLMEYLSHDLSRISLQEQDHAKDLHCASPCSWNPPRLTNLSSSDPQTERIIEADRTKWHQLRDVYCHYYHGAEYVDLEFKRQTCP